MTEVFETASLIYNDHSDVTVLNKQSNNDLITVEYI